MRTCVCTHLCMCVRMCAHACACMPVRACVRADVRGRGMIERECVCGMNCMCVCAWHGNAMVSLTQHNRMALHSAARHGACEHVHT